MNEKLKILIIVSSFPKPPNLMNISPWALEQTKELAELADCTVVSPTPKLWIPKVFNKLLSSKVRKWSSIEKKHNFGKFVVLYPRVPIRTYTRKVRFNSSSQVVNLWTEVVEKSINVKIFDIVLAHHPMMEGLIAKNLKDKCSIPFITIEHSRGDPFNGNNEYLKNYSSVADSANAFICPSRYLLNQIVSKYSVKNPMVIRNGGANPIKELKKLDFSSGKIKFISVGALSEYKNHRTLIKAFDDPILREKAELEIIGDGHLRKEYEDLIKSMGLQNTIKLLGSISNNLVLKKLDEAHVFVLISNESFSVAAVEAMSRGCLIVLSESTGVSELMTDGIQGFVINKDGRMDFKYVSSILKRVIAEPSLILKMRRPALELSKNLTWKENAKQMLEVIRGEIY